MSPPATVAREAALAGVFAGIEAAFARARAHPLSTRKALLVAVLLDNACDEVFERLRFAAPGPVFEAEDVLAFRERLRRAEPAFSWIFDLCAMAPDAPRLVLQAVEVPIDDYGKLSVEDFMVSLYNGHTVQRVVLRRQDGEMCLAHEVLSQAIAALGARATSPRLGSGVSSEE